RARAKAPAKLRFTERQEGNQIRRVKPRARLVGGLIGGPRLDVVGADFLANVAAENVIADQRAQGFGHPILELDGEIRNAAARVEHVGTDESAGGTRFETELAAPAAVAQRAIVGQRQIDEQLAEKKPRAALRRNQVRVLADPAQAGDAGEVALQHRSRIDEDPALNFPAAKRAHGAEQIIELAFHQLVIIVAP